MTRLNVSEEFRMMQTNCNFTMKFSKTADMEKAYKAIESAINEIDTSKFYKDYKDLWLQDLSDCRDKNEFYIESTLDCNAFTEYIPVMCEAVAKAMPEIQFNGEAIYDDLKCYWIDEYKFNYGYGLLWISERLEDDECGYFCPECGNLVANINEKFENDEIVCDECGKVFKVWDLNKVNADMREIEIEID